MPSSHRYRAEWKPEVSAGRARWVLVLGVLGAIVVLGTLVSCAANRLATPPPEFEVSERVVGEPIVSPAEPAQAAPAKDLGPSLVADIERDRIEAQRLRRTRSRERVEAARPTERTSLPTSIRVGLASDVTEFSLPCCQQSYVLRVGNQKSGLTIPAGTTVSLRPVARDVRAGVFRVQVAALKDEQQAEGLAQRLAQLSGEPADAVFDAGLDLYRVRVGRYNERPAAERLSASLRAQGGGEGWVVEEGAGLVDPGFELTSGRKARRLSGRWLSITSDAPSMMYGGRRFRGRLLLYINSRGRLNVVNQLPIDDYLRGVLPREMGPAQYPYLEALKAQAVAARTYTLYNLGEFASEGYDICATPRCQVYGGQSSEHPLTDRAVLETRGEVLLYGEGLAESLYSASCGGHTEDVDIVFPLKSSPYLEGLACIEAGPERVALRGEIPSSLEAWLRARLGAGGAASDTQVVEGALSRGELRRVRAHLLGVEGERIRLRVGGQQREVVLSPQLLTGVEKAGASGRYQFQSLNLYPGDRVDVWMVGQSVVALIQVDQVLGTPNVEERVWNRFRSDQQLANLVGARYPGVVPRNIEVLERGDSGRVARVMIEAADGNRIEIAGLAIRWTFDVLDTQFTVARHTSRSGAKGWMFRGRGHGHGVGMCQLGAVAMAQRGHDYRQILGHYYTGVSLGELSRE